jgi:hypothetical protein
MPTWRAYVIWELLGRNCLAHNKSCAKAWEYQGLIYEKEGSFANAAEVGVCRRMHVRMHAIHVRIHAIHVRIHAIHVCILA